ncbi:glycerophosphoryl diester phosphodiesterase [Pontibacter ummariensis]|uniref:Glycerophosphoryl diester phosphodiesterase n=2 Tax=Pontibacter ummariensis TaxID=1610492 RepID=A0A239HQY0_9BACT|nr:glycerophosphoryl diester phosphodiesterase [Pontibacter ummariensis]SNS83585.1 glycerophosphoryl diester phosphodiesterase [Pontibacter ummariensis]
MLLVLAIVLLAFAAGVFLLYRHEKLEYKEVLVLGHAGSGFFSPINPFNPLPANSMASIVKAMEAHGADGVEVDVQLSEDGVPILYHDMTLESMTAAEGLIENHVAADVIGLKYDGGFFYNLFQEEEIITMEALLQYFATYQEAPYLHLDLRNYSPERHAYYARTLMALLREYRYPLQKLVFISPDPDFLQAFREVEPGAQLMLDTGGDFEQALQTVAAYEIGGICANGGSVTAEQVARAKELGLEVALFGGKSRSSIARMINLRPDAIQVNNVEAMRDMLD